MIRLSKEEQALFDWIHSSIEDNKHKGAEEIKKGVEGLLGGRRISLRLAGAVINDAYFMLYRSPAKDLIWDVTIKAFDSEVVRKGIDDDKVPSESSSQRVISAITEVYGSSDSKIKELWNNLGLDQASYDERLVFYKAIATRGLPCDFAIFFEDIVRCSSLEERVDRCSDLSESCCNSLNRDFLQHFHELGFIDDLNNCSNLEQRVQVCEQIASLGFWAAMGLAANFDKLGLQEVSFQQKMTLCRTFVAQGLEAEEAVTTHLSTILGLAKEIERRTTIRERLDFCKEIAQEEEWAAKGLITYFDKLGLGEASFDEWLELFRTIVGQGYNTENKLVYGFSDKLGMVNAVNRCKEVNDRFDICMKIVQQGGWGARAIAIFFDKLQLQEGSPEQRFQLCMAIVKQQQRQDFFPATYYLAESFDKLGLKKLPWKKRLSLFREIASSGGNVTWKILEKKFPAFGFIDDINQCSDPEESLKLCREIICDEVGCRVDWAEQGLFSSLSQLDFVKKIADKDLKQRFTLSMSLTQLGPWCANYVMEDFFELKLNELSADQRLSLYMALTQQGAHVPGLLASYFIHSPEKLAWEDFTLQQSCDLYVEIVQKGENDATKLFVNNFKNLGLDGDEAKPLRLHLLIAIAQKDIFFARKLLMHSKDLNLQNLSVPERHQLCAVIAQQGSWSMGWLINTRGDIGLHNESLQQQMTFWLAMARQNKGNAKVLAQFLPGVALDKESLITLATVISNGGVSVRSDFLRGDGTLKRELFFIFSAPPSRIKMREQLPSYMKPVAVLVPLLTKGEGDIFSDEEIKSLETFIATNEQLKKILERLLSSLLDELKPKKPPKTQPTALIRWLAHAAARFNDFDNAQIALIEKNTLLEDIYKTQLPQQRYRLLNGLIYLVQRKPEKLATFAKLAPKDKPPAKASLLILPLREVGFSDDGLNILFKKIKEHSKMFKDSRKLDALLQLFSAVAANGLYSDKEGAKMVKIVEKIFGEKKKGEKEVMRDLQICTNLLQLFGKEELLIGEKEPQAIFQEKFAELFDVSGRVPNIAEAYQETIAKFRDSTALFTYWRTVNKLREEERREVHKTFNVYVEALLTGNFPDVRYNDEAVAKSQHLKTLFGHDPGVKAKWLEKADPKPVFFETEQKGSLFDAKKFLRHEVIEDRHLEPDLFPRLVAFINNEPVGEPGDPKKPAEQFEVLAIGFCEGKLATQQFVDKVKKLENFPLPKAFEDNLDSLLEVRAAAGEYWIEESDDACDLLLIGTEIQGSCQRVDGDPKLNKGLTAYLMNGEIRVIAIKRGGKLVARSIMRLLWDSKKQCPVLLLERSYKNVQHSAIDDAIKGWAIDKAKAMSISLVSKESEGDSKNGPYDGTVEFLGGYAPFTYSDAARGIIPRAQHATIQGANLLYVPAAASRLIQVPL